MKPRNDAEMLKALNATSAILDRLQKMPGGIVDLYARIRAESSTIRAANYDSSHANRVDADGFNLPDHADPTGDTAVDDREASLMDELKTDIHTMLSAAERIDRKRHDFLRDKPAQLTEDGPGLMWCHSCWRDDQHCEPTSERYKKYCRWCGDVTNELGEMPNVKLVEARHRGQRITDRMVMEYHPDAQKAG